MTTEEKNKDTIILNGINHNSISAIFFMNDMAEKLVKKYQEEEGEYSYHKWEIKAININGSNFFCVYDDKNKKNKE